MSEKTIKSRVVNKHDTSANWAKANFVPKQGEIIVYDIDDTYDYERLKVGDGTTNINALPFVDDAVRVTVDNALSTTSINPVQNKVVSTAIGNLETLVGETSVAEQISAAITNKADLVSGKVPVDQLPSTFSGQEITITAENKIQVGSVVYVIEGDDINPYPKTSSISVDASDYALADTVTAIAFSPDGNTVIIGGWFVGGAKVYSRSGTKLTYVRDLYADVAGGALDDTVTFAEFTPDGNVLIIAGYFTGGAKVYSVDGTNIVYVRDIYQDNAETAIDSGIYAFALSKDGTKLALGGFYNGPAKIYSVSGTNVTYVDDIYADNAHNALSNDPTCIAFSPDGNLLALTGYNYVKIYSVSGTTVSFIRDIDNVNPSTGKTYMCVACAFSPDGKLFIVDGYGDTLARIFSVSGITFTLSGTIPLRTQSAWDDDSLNKIAFSNDGSLVVLAGGFAEWASLYRVSGTNITYVDDFYSTSTGLKLTDVAYCANFSPDDSVLILGGDFDGVCKVYGKNQQVVSALDSEYVADYSVAVAQEDIEAGESGKILVVANIKSPDISGQIEAHNASETAHNDIRTAVTNLNTLVGDLPVSEQISTATASLATQEYVDNKSPKTLTGTEESPVILVDLDVGIYEIPYDNYYKYYSSDTSYWSTSGTTLIVYKRTESQVSGVMFEANYGAGMYDFSLAIGDPDYQYNVFGSPYLSADQGKDYYGRVMRVGRDGYVSSNFDYISCFNNDRSVPLVLSDLHEQCGQASYLRLEGCYKVYPEDENIVQIQSYEATAFYTRNGTTKCSVFIIDKGKISQYYIDLDSDEKYIKYEYSTQSYVDAAIDAMSAQIEAHNTSETAHSDIRANISNLNTLVGDTPVADQIASATNNTIKITVVNSDGSMTAADVCNLATGWYFFALPFEYTDARGDYFSIENFTRIRHLDELTGPQAYIYNYDRGWFYLLRQDDGVYSWDLRQSLDGTSDDIYSLQNKVAKKLDATDASWTQIYDSSEITSEVNSFQNIDITGYKSLIVVVKCVNSENTTDSRSGAVYFGGANSQLYKFDNIFSNLLKKDTSTSGAMAKFKIVDGFIICENAMRAIVGDGILSDTEGAGIDTLGPVSGGLVRCTSALTSMAVTSAAQSSTHYYGVGSRVVVWGCKV